MVYFPHKHILAIKQFSREDLETVFETAKEMEKILTWEKPWDLLKGKIMASMFYEPSTRTRLSFECAMRRLWWKVITVADASSCSLSKWETLEDNAKIVSIYSDVIVMRHPENNSVEKSAAVVSKPVINAWDGSNEHPTQALLDIYTIFKEKGRIDKLKIALVGDLRYGRTAHSLVFFAGLFKNVEFTFISCESLKMPEKVISFLKEKNIKYRETTDYKEGIRWSDVLYVTRIQKERFPSEKEYESVKNDFILTKETLLDTNPDITILHPLPRVNEIDHEIDTLPNAAFFRQAENGVPVRMALLYLVLK